MYENETELHISIPFISVAISVTYYYCINKKNVKKIEDKR